MCDLCSGRGCFDLYSKAEEPNHFTVTEFRCPVCLAAEGKRPEAEAIIDQIRLIGADDLLSRIYAGFAGLLVSQASS